MKKRSIVLASSAASLLLSWYLGVNDGANRTREMLATVRAEVMSDKPSFPRAAQPVVEEPNFLEKAESQVSTTARMEANSWRYPENPTLAKAIDAAAARHGVEPATLHAVAALESRYGADLHPNWGTATLTAGGNFGFIKASWRRAVAVYWDRPDKARVAQPRMRDDPAVSAEVAALVMKADNDWLAGHLGRAPKAGETYLMYFLGRDRAWDFLEALAKGPNRKAAPLFHREAKVNKPLFYEDGRALSLHEILTRMQDRMDGKRLAFMRQRAEFHLERLGLGPMGS